MADGVGVGVRRRRRSGVTYRDHRCYPNLWDRKRTDRLPVGATGPGV